MSLELFSQLEFEIPKEILNDIYIILQEEYKYQNVYVSSYGSYGFIRYGESYNSKEPPLFDLLISDSSVILSVFGDLNDQRNIKEQVTHIFSEKNISLDFIEE